MMLAHASQGRHFSQHFTAIDDAAGDDAGPPPPSAPARHAAMMPSARAGGMFHRTSAILFRRPSALLAFALSFSQLKEAPLRMSLPDASMYALGRDDFSPAGVSLLSLSDSGRSSGPTPVMPRYFLSIQE